MIPLVILKITFHKISNLEWRGINLGYIIDLFNFGIWILKLITLAGTECDVYAVVASRMVGAY
jgi:hypothetical protein